MSPNLSTKKQFFSYVAVGVVNTAIHWAVFFATYSISGQQWLSNISGFLTAVSFSYFANAKHTFNKNPNWSSYWVFTFLMGLLSFCIGLSADHLLLSPLLTLITTSAASLIIGFAFSKKVVFR